MQLYHGSSKIIEHPIFGAGKVNNDYGLAFYCTEDIELAREWASQSAIQNGFVNEYSLNMKGLRVLDLTDAKYNILNWLAILLENRTFEIKSDIARQGFDFLNKNFLPDYTSFDVIKGYRADDSYFRFATAFLNNEISLQQLSRAMSLGKLGMQIAIKSETAFSKIKFEDSTMVDTEIYFDKRMGRDAKARNDYSKLKTEIGIDGTYMIDIIRQKWRNEDVRI